jgi:hypothetical protein
MSEVLKSLIDEMREQGRDDEADELEKLSGSSLREKARAAERLEKENADLKAKLDKVEAAPKIKKAFEDFGVDFEALTKAEKKMLEGYDGELDDEAVAAFVEEFEFPLSEANDAEEGDETPPAERIANQAKSGGGRTKTPGVSPADVSGWSIERSMAFMDSHPEEWEALKRGETVIVGAT